MEKEKKKKKHKKLPIVLVAIAAVVVVLILVNRQGGPSDAVIVTTASVTSGSVQESISTSGTIESETKKIYFAPVGGTIDAVHVEAGDEVKAGDWLVSYKMDDMESMVEQASLQQKRSDAVYNGGLSDSSANQAKLNEANTNLEVLNQQITDWTANLKNLQKQLEDTQRGTANALAGESYHLSVEAADLQKELSALDPESSEYAKKAALLEEVQQKIQYNQYAQSVASSSDTVAELQRKIAQVQEELNGFEEYKARMESQKSASESMVLDGYARTQYEVDNELARMTYEDAVADYDIAAEGIRASFDGIVTECSAVEGATVMEGTQMLTLASSNEIKVVFQASRSDVEKLKLGQKVDVTISGQLYEGAISKIDRMASPNQSGTPMVNAEVHIKKPDNKIILGLDAKLYIYTNYVENTLLVPAEAINADRDGDFLYVVSEGAIVRRPIVCGISSDNYVEVKEGVSAGEEIVLTAQGEIREGMTAIVTE